ncbi:hypothetical protein GX586_04130 [bacterium]|nr:hypothetical protein [bacterium]
MKITLTSVFLATTVILFAACVPAAPATAGDATNATAAADEDAILPDASAQGGTQAVEEVVSIEPDMKQQLSRPPSLLEFKQQIRQVQSTGSSVDLYSDKLNVKSAAQINELFQRCRTMDIDVYKAGKSALAQRAEALLTDKNMLATKRYRVYQLKGTHFSLYAVGPVQTKMYQRGKLETVKFDDELQKILAAADKAFQNAANSLVMQSFINWAAVRGRIYVLYDPEHWRLIRSQSLKNQPVQTVITQPKHREFFLYVGPRMLDYADQAIGFAVAGAVYDEFGQVTTGRSEPRYPLFYRTGLAALAGGLDAVVTEDGPVQSTEVMGRRIMRPDREVDNPNVVVPGRTGVLLLSKRVILPFKDLVSLTQFPSSDERTYAVILQSAEAVKSLREKAPLALVVLTKELATEPDFRKSVGAAYMNVQRDMEGRAAQPAKSKSRDRKSDDDADSEQDMAGTDFSDFKRLDSYMDKTVFPPLTAEALVESRKSSQSAKPGGKRTGY